MIPSSSSSSSSECLYIYVYRERKEIERDSMDLTFEGEEERRNLLSTEFLHGFESMEKLLLCRAMHACLTYYN